MAIREFFASFILLVMLSSASVLAAQEVFFSGMSTDNDTYVPGSNLTFETTIINSDQSPQTNLTLYCKLLRVSDGAVIYSVPEVLDLGSKEVLPLKRTIVIPSEALSGNYEISIGIVSSSGTPLSSISQEVLINSSKPEGILFSQGGFYLKVPITKSIAEGVTQTDVEYMYGLVGDTIPQGNPISAQVSLSNAGSSDQNLSAKLEIIPSYRKPSLNNSSDIIGQPLGILRPGENKSYSIDFSISQPGTYSVILAIYSGGTFMAQKEIRAVVGGEDGTILDVENYKATYSAGDDVAVDVSFVGPADKSTVKDAYVQLEVLSAGRTLGILRKDNVSLSPQPGLEQFRLKAQEDLENYDIAVTLGKGDTVFDKSLQSYKPMEPNITVTEDGRFFPKNESGCFDDSVCTQEEQSIGNCLDCTPIKKTAERVEAERYDLYTILAFAILGIIILLFIVLMLRSKPKNETL